MHVAVVTFPGSNCDDDCHHVCRAVFGATTIRVWHKETSLPKGVDLVILPGGFSYGDYLRTGALARFSPIMTDIARFASSGGPVLGICNGFQILCEAGLLPGALLRNTSLRFICETVSVRVETRDTSITQSLDKGRVLRLPIAHMDGNYFAEDDTLKELRESDRVLLRYCSATGDVNDDSNPNGSRDNIAGITNASRNVFGMMPHPERASEAPLASTDGRDLLAGLLGGLL
jgi:phosphoribosylformylglycinamidine synthase